MPIAEDPEPRPSEGRQPAGSDPAGAGGKDPFADLVLDEEFVKGAAVKEQSGRTRMLAAQWKHTPPVDPGGRRSVNDGPAKARRFGRRPKPTDPWGTARPRRRLEWRTPLYVVLTIALLLAVLNLDGLRSWYSTHFGHADVTSVPTAAPGAAGATAAPPKADAKQPTVDHPWAGSPAEGWPTGAEAFVLPQAQATGVFGADQVAAQLALVKDYLTAANLDPKVTAGGRPEAALALLDRAGRDKAAAALAKPSDQSDPTTWFSRFDAHDAIPATDTVKVKGTVSVEGDGERGVLVHTDFTYVYALRPGPEAARRPAPTRPAAPTAPARTEPGGGTARPVGLLVPAADVAGDTWTARTVVRRVETFRFHDPARYGLDPKKIFIDKSLSYFGNTECGTFDGFFHPHFDQFAKQPNPAQSGPTRDPYDLGKELPEDETCGTVSRS
ncbi:hypothetical protein ACGFZP_25920 [Kitasatospora sp. NPDC048239]|uniref:SCO2583/SCO2584 N-terminal domain-containing protein n=1 Tax=Kitasatospora sp. NPDC048239 TaxID=3364046 RepID=UPI00371826EA